MGQLRRNNIDADWNIAGVNPRRRNYSVSFSAFVERLARSRDSIAPRPIERRRELRRKAIPRLEKNRPGHAGSITGLLNPTYVQRTCTMREGSLRWVFPEFT